MAEPLSVLSLPAEVIEHIAFCHILSYSDVVNLQFSCKALHSVLRGNDQTWMTRFVERWPKCLSPKQRKEVKNWRMLYLLRESWERKISSMVLCATELLLHKDQTPDCILPAVFKQVELYEDFTAECIIDALFELCTPIQNPTLSQQYYAFKLLNKLRSKYLKRRWEKLVSDSGGTDNIPLEDGVWFVGELIEPERDYRSLDMDKFLTQLVESTVVRIGTSDAPLADRIYSFVNTLSQEVILHPDKWTPRENYVIMMEVISTVTARFFSEEDSIGTETRGTLQQVLSHTNTVPSRLLVALLIVCAARRLGIHCQMMALPLPNLGFTLKFQGSESSESDSGWTYLAPNMRLKSEAPEWENSPQVSNTHLEVLSHYAELAVPNNINLTILEVKEYLSPNNLSYTQSLLVAYFRALINIDKAKLLLQRLGQVGRGHYGQLFNRYTELVGQLSEEDELKIPDIEINKRSDPANSDVRHSVGMIMTHVRLGYSCVITGWTSVCEADELWIIQMGVDRLPLGPNQPFYHVLVADGSNRYAAQENLQSHHSPQSINHHSVGRYFESFDQSHYIMNHAQAKLYPDDTNFTICAAKRLHPSLCS